MENKLYEGEYTYKLANLVVHVVKDVPFDLVLRFIGQAKLLLLVDHGHLSLPDQLSLLLCGDLPLAQARLLLIADLSGSSQRQSCHILLDFALIDCASLQGLLVATAALLAFFRLWRSCLSARRLTTQVNIGFWRGRSCKPTLGVLGVEHLDSERCCRFCHASL